MGVSLKFSLDLIFYFLIWDEQIIMKVLFGSDISYVQFTTPTIHNYHIHKYYTQNLLSIYFL